MAYSSLRDFIDRLESDGRLVRVSEPVSPNLEMTEIQTRLLAEGGPAVLFENVVRDDGTPYDMPVLVNLFGTVERVAWGMNREPDQLREIGDTLAFLRQPDPPDGIRGAMKALPLLKTVMAMKPKTVKSAPCQDIVLSNEDIDLSRLPVQTCWPGEPAPLITWPLVVTQGPEAGQDGGDSRDDFNLGIYRMQVTGPNTTYMRWLKHRGGAQHHSRWKGTRPDPLPAAAVIGADPGTILAAVTPVPDTLSEYHFAGLLRDKKVELVDCKTIPLKVPAQAEIVDFWLPPEACSYRACVVSIKKAYPGHAKRIMMAVWSYLRQFMYTKFVIVVDEDIDARDWKDVIWAVSTNVDPARDITLIENTPIDYLDFASPESGLGSKMGIDATSKIPPETNRQWGRKIRMTDDIIDEVTKKWEAYGLPGSGKPIWK